MAEKVNGEKDSFLKKVWDGITRELITKFILSIFVISVPTTTIIHKLELSGIESKLNELKSVIDLSLQKPPLVLLKTSSPQMPIQGTDAIFPLMFDDNAKISEDNAYLIDKGVEITNRHKTILDELLISLRPCAGEKESEKVVLEIFGFASSAAFEGLPNDESNEWNRHASNRRGKSAKKYLDTVSKNPNGKAYFGELLDVKFEPWKTYEEMVGRRPYFDQPLGKEKRQAERLNRRIEVKLISAGKCEAIMSDS